MVRAGCAATTCAPAPRSSPTRHPFTLRACQRRGRSVSSTPHCDFLIDSTAIRNARNSPANNIITFSNRQQFACLRAHFALLASLRSNHFSPLAAFLIATGPELKFHVTHSQETRKLFLIATFSPLFSGFARIIHPRSTNLPKSPAEISRDGSPSHGDDIKARERGSVEAGVEREEPVALVGCGGHRPRSWRMARTMALRPVGMPGLPMPRYFSNGFSACRTVIWPFRVMRLFFFSAAFAIPHFSKEFVTFASGNCTDFRAPTTHSPLPLSNRESSILEPSLTHRKQSPTLRSNRQKTHSALLPFLPLLHRAIPAAAHEPFDHPEWRCHRASLTVARRSSKLLVSTGPAIRSSARAAINCEGEDRCRNALFSRMCGADIKSTGFASA
jgi:hypothetical protein